MQGTSLPDSTSGSGCALTGFECHILYCFCYLLHFLSEIYFSWMNSTVHNLFIVRLEISSLCHMIHFLFKLPYIALKIFILLAIQCKWLNVWKKSYLNNSTFIFSLFRFPISYISWVPKKTKCLNWPERCKSTYKKHFNPAFISHTFALLSAEFQRM